MSKFLLMCIVASLFSGCVSYHAYSQTLRQLITEGKCDEAMQLIREHNEIPFDFQIMERGIVYHGCYKDMKKASDYYTLAARYNNKAAIETLVSLGLPVPTADLASTSSSQGEAGWADIIGAGVKATQKGK